MFPVAIVETATAADGSYAVIGLPEPVDAILIDMAAFGALCEDEALLEGAMVD
jgi:hypothetical protein